MGGISCVHRAYVHTHPHTHSVMHMYVAKTDASGHPIFILPKMYPDILLPKLGPIISRNMVLTHKVDVTKLVFHHLEMPGPDSC